MKVIKIGSANSAGLDAALELEAVNAFAKTRLRAEDVYLFSILLCDNEVDRDFERFSERTLEELRELFVGKTGIFDHEWSSGKQKARIYRTELVAEKGRVNSQGMPYMFLKGCAYMLRSESNAELISEIEAGIKKETSIGCSIARHVCSICGEEISGGKCAHRPGETYKGKLCYAELLDAVDAYEWSFVAVPAQKKAGVMKKYGKAKSLKAFIESREGQAFASEYEELERDAELGKRYMQQLRDEALRLSLMCDKSLHAALKQSSGKMSAQELCELKKAFEETLAEKYPPTTQLPGRAETVAFDDGEYRI